MKTRVLGKSGFQVSVVGLGGIPIQRVSFEEAERIVHTCLDAGIDFIDTARGYTNSEEKIGRALKNHRTQVVLATKTMARDFEGMSKDIETSLKNLQTDYIDLYQIHGISSEQDLNKILGENGALKALAAAKDKGCVRSIGVTGHIRSILVKALETGFFDTVQLPFNFIEQEALEDVIPLARSLNVGIIGMKPVAGGALKKVPAALRFSLDRGVDVVIPGMDALEQVGQNASVGQDFRSPSSLELEDLEREKEIWSGVFCRRCNYCQPCPNGLNISFLLLLQAYYERYSLKEWAMERLRGVEKKYDDCKECGECVERCPYNLPIPKLLKKAASQMI